MTERLKQAIAQAEKLSAEEQDTIAELMLREMAAEARWDELLNTPESVVLLERMAAQAIAEDDAGLTRDLDELL